MKVNWHVDIRENLVECLLVNIYPRILIPKDISLSRKDLKGMQLKLFHWKNIVNVLDILSEAKLKI